MKPVLVKPGLFRDRREAGRLLAQHLAACANRPDVLVLALPRGGVPVAYEVARALHAPLSSTSTIPMPLSRWSGQPNGCAATCPRRTRSACDPHGKHIQMSATPCVGFVLSHEQF